MKKAEFELRRKLIELEAKKDKLKHNFHMKELEYQEKIENLKHQNEMENQRIKEAGIRRSQERMANLKFMKE